MVKYIDQWVNKEKKKWKKINWINLNLKKLKISTY